MESGYSKHLNDLKAEIHRTKCNTNEASHTYDARFAESKTTRLKLNKPVTSTLNEQTTGEQDQSEDSLMFKSQVLLQAKSQLYDRLQRERVLDAADTQLCKHLLTDFSSALHEKWRREREHNVTCDEIHYQNVTFDEAREHGAGYFRFSRDATERAAQMRELNRLEAHSERARDEARVAAEKRRLGTSERVRRARERRRLARGLTINIDSTDNTECVESVADVTGASVVCGNDFHGAADSGTCEPSAESVLAAERRRQHLREWDVGKQRATATGTVFMEESEWLEQERKRRKAEFAPPISYCKRGSAATSSISYNIQLDSCETATPQCCVSQHDTVSPCHKVGPQIRGSNHIGYMPCTPTKQPCVTTTLQDSKIPSTTPVTCDVARDVDAMLSVFRYQLVDNSTSSTSSHVVSNPLLTDKAATNFECAS